MRSFVRAANFNVMDAVKTLMRIVMGVALIGAGIAHLTFQRVEFQAQVPDWFPLDEDFVVIGSGIVEIALGLAAILIVRHKALVGWTIAAFFVVIFPGNLWQWIEGKDAFGLDTDAKRFGRLFLQPVFIAIALYATNAWTNRPFRNDKH